MGLRLNMKRKIILDLCGGTGSWSKPMKTQGKIDKSMFNTEKWVEVKDAPIPNINILMQFIDAYRSPQAHLEPKEFLSLTKLLIEKYAKAEQSALLQRVIELIGELEKTITQMGVDPERRLNPDENDIKREMHNKGRAFGYTEALYDLKTKISQMGEEL